MHPVYTASLTAIGMVSPRQYPCMYAVPPLYASAPWHQVSASSCMRLPHSTLFISLHFLDGNVNKTPVAQSYPGCPEQKEKGC